MSLECIIEFSVFMNLVNMLRMFEINGQSTSSNHSAVNIGQNGLTTVDSACVYFMLIWTIAK